MNTNLYFYLKFRSKILKYYIIHVKLYKLNIAGFPGNYHCYRSDMEIVAGTAGMPVKPFSQK